MMTSFAAAVLGGSGQVGGCVIKALLGESRCSSVILLNRRHLEKYDGESRVQQHVVNMDDLEAEASPILQKADVSACFVTMGAGQPSKITEEQLKHVDVVIPTEFAKASKVAGCVKHISLLSSVGADASCKPSRLTGTVAGGGLYLGLKGQVEKNFEDVGLESVGIFRPATLVGNANTPGWAPVASKMVSWALPMKYKEIHIEALGAAMVKAGVASLDAKGPAVSVYEGNTLFGLL